MNRCSQSKPNVNIVATNVEQEIKSKHGEL